MFIGALIFITLMAMGGIIAFLGDKIGSKVGKKRLTLFGLRPRYTSVIVTIISGILISTMTVAVLAVLNENVRVALFGLSQLHAEMDSLGREIQEKNKELEQGKTDLAMRTKELERVESQRAYMETELASVQAAYDEAKEGVARSAEEIAELEATRNELTGNIDKLNHEKETLISGITAIREGTVVFRAGQVLTDAVVDGGMTREQSEQVLASILNDINNMLKDRMNITDENAYLVRIPQEAFDRAVNEVTGAENKKLVRVVAAGNLILGEPAVVEFDVYDNKLIFSKGEVIFTQDMQQYKELKSYEMQVLRYLKDLNRFATGRGMLPDPITGNIGQLEGQELLGVINQVKECGGKCKLSAIVKKDTYSEGPLLIDVKVERTGAGS